MRPRRRISPAADEFARSGKGTGEARRTVFDEYLRELQKVTLLTPAEEAAFWQRYRHGGDVESRIRLIEAYQPLAEELVPGSALGDLEAELSLLRVEDRVLHEQIRAAIAALPGRERAILRAFLSRENPREVASVLRISLSHFYRLQKQAIERVRAIIRAPAPHPEAP